MAVPAIETADRLRPPENAAAVGVMYYDASCGVCSTWARRASRLLRANGFELAPLPAEMLESGPGEIKLRLRDGNTLGGADAIVELSRRISLLRPLALIAIVPGGMGILRWLYRGLARHRYTFSRRCSI